MGVYRIRNTLNNRSYITAKIDIAARFNRHRKRLKRIMKTSKHCIQSMLEYEKDAFEFETLDRLAPLDTVDSNPTEDLKTLERFC